MKSDTHRFEFAILLRRNSIVVRFMPVAPDRVNDIGHFRLVVLELIVLVGVFIVILLALQIFFSRGRRNFLVDGLLAVVIPQNEPVQLIDLFVYLMEMTIVPGVSQRVVLSNGCRYHEQQQQQRDFLDGNHLKRSCYMFS